MKLLSKPSFSLRLFTTLVLLSWVGCKSSTKDPDIKLPVLGSVSLSEVKISTAKATCSLKDAGFGVLGTSTIKEYGICFATKENPTTSDTKVAVGTTATAPLDIVANLTGLTAGTGYFVRGYAVYDGGTVYSDPAQFTTDNLKGPEVATGDATDLTTTALSITGKLTSLGTSDVTQYGHVLSATNQTPTTADTKTELGTANAVPKDFKSVFTSLKANTTYYVRAYAQNTTGIGYSDVKTVKTTNEAVPVVVTQGSDQLTYNSVRVLGTVSNAGTQAVTQFGHCWSTDNQNPTTSNAKSEFGATATPKDYATTMSGLSANTTYYVRAYATSGAGTGYGDVKTIKTLNAVAPTASTENVTNITYTEATVGMNILSVGTNSSIQAGVCWSSSNQNPTTADAKTTIGANATQFFSNYIPNLTPNTIYYVRAYATSPDGTGYGNVKTFTTLNGAVPTVETQLASSPGLYDANFTGRMLTNNTPYVSQYGHVWSSSNQSPTTNDAKTQLGSTTRTQFDYISPMPNLTPGTTYYVRAYATNAIGTGYGAIKTVSTFTLQAPTFSSMAAQWFTSEVEIYYKLGINQFVEKINTYGVVENDGSDKNLGDPVVDNADSYFYKAQRDLSTTEQNTLKSSLSLEVHVFVQKGGTAANPTGANSGLTLTNGKAAKATYKKMRPYAIGQSGAVYYGPVYKNF